MQSQLLDRYLELLLEANRVMNLTSITDPAAARLLHVEDSLTLLPFLPAGAIRLADVGSGGGAPGIPLAIARPECRITCIEATKKKAAFLEKTASELGLKNIRVLDQRAEEIGRGELRETYDIAVARAVGAMVWVAEWLLPLVKINGKVLAMKGAKAGGELADAAIAIGKLGGGKPLVHPVQLPGTADHVIVEIPKIRKTPPAFPRSAPDAKRKPIH